MQAGSYYYYLKHYYCILQHQICQTNSTELKNLYNSMILLPGWFCLGNFDIKVTIFLPDFGIKVTIFHQIL